MQTHKDEYGAKFQPAKMCWFFWHFIAIYLLNPEHSELWEHTQNPKTEKHNISKVAIGEWCWSGLVGSLSYSQC